MNTHTDQTIASVVRARLAAAQEAASALAPDSSYLKLCKRINIAEAISNLTRERRTGAAAEASQELEKRRPLEQGNSIRIPWQTLAYATTRADVAGTSTAGGYLVPTLNTDTAAGSLLSMMMLGRLSCTPIDSSANLNLPKVASNATVNWLSTETTPATESDLSFAQVGYSPHTISGYTELSRQLAITPSPSASNLIANELMRRVRRAIESAVFSGSGVNGQPHGLLNMAGVTQVSGTSFSLSTAVTCQTNAGDALTDDAGPGWVVNRAVAGLLRQRGEVLGAVNSFVPLWRGALTWGQLVDTTAGSSSGVPASTAIFGCWSYMVVVDFGGGLDVAVNPYGAQGGSTNFQQGIIGVRCLATIDCAPIWPGAFSVVSSIT
jgi:HK97 family phage major capsid protein